MGDFIMKNLFEVGDKVFDYRYGWGEVVEDIEFCDIYPVMVRFKYRNVFYTLDGCREISIGPSLSFKEYNFVSGGLTHERPEVEIEPGTLVYVKDENEQWFVRFYSHKNCGKHYVFVNQGSSGETVTYKYVSCELPKELT